MLILTRRKGASIIIDNSIIITLINIGPETATVWVKSKALLKLLFNNVHYKQNGIVLRMYYNDFVIINENIKITLIIPRLRNNCQRSLGIEAPREMPIYREEIQHRIDRGDPICTH